MSEIRVLPDEISNRIAAGEVVERPASVVKELVENAIDAGATHIQIEIGRAGTRLIAVTDNGSGMDEDDALLCLEPHGTSKIRDAADMERIRTLGFRGEAIPSIASVSHFVLKTRRREQSSGLEVEVKGGTVAQTRPAGGAPGTRIEVRDLFFNVPARKKFLRSFATEEGHIQETVLMLALPYPEIGFELWFDGKPVFRTAGDGDLRNRLRGFFGKAAAERYLEIAPADEPVKVSGFIASPEWTRSTRREQRTFINGRMVDSPAIYRGIREGYAERAEAGRFPPTVLFVAMDPGEFDINVHPTKREVRFRNDQVVVNAVRQAVRRTLGQAPGPRLQWTDRIPMDAILEGANINYRVDTADQPELAGIGMLTDHPVVPEPVPIRLPEASEEVDSVEPVPLRQMPEPVPAEPPPPAPTSAVVSQWHPPAEEGAETTPEPETRLLGIFENCYMLVERDGELWIIDQHAAHERVMFERLLERRRTAGAIQQLLLPVTLELDRRTAQFLDRHRHCFAQLGFDLAELSQRSILVSGIPSDLPQGLHIERLILDIFEELQAETGNASAILPLDAVARAACHAAVKAHDVLTEPEALGLLRSLLACSRPDCCPHGRPTTIRLTRRELERRFGRV